MIAYYDEIHGDIVRVQEEITPEIGRELIMNEPVELEKLFEGEKDNERDE